eukprot:3399220-Lingulodinium_polyedra.AAC.1
MPHPNIPQAAPKQHPHTVYKRRPRSMQAAPKQLANSTQQARPRQHLSCTTPARKQHQGSTQAPPKQPPCFITRTMFHYA